MPLLQGQTGGRMGTIYFSCLASKPLMSPGDEVQLEVINSTSLSYCRVSNYHQCSGSKWHQFIMSPFRRSRVQTELDWSLCSVDSQGESKVMAGSDIFVVRGVPFRLPQFWAGFRPFFSGGPSPPTLLLAVIQPPFPVPREHFSALSGNSSLTWNLPPLWGAHSIRSDLPGLPSFLVYSKSAGE